jgi:DNA repair protein RecO (recombination protein O)
MLSSDHSNRRQRSLRLEAVVLKHSDWGEADRLVWLFSREQGKLKAIAKGARKPRSRKAGHLEPFTRVSLQVARGRDLPIITQAETLEAYLPLREDLLRTTFAAYAVELLDRFTFEEGEHQALYRLLADTLDRLCQPLDSDLTVRYYEMRLLDLVGFRPQLFACTNCNREIIAEDQFFSAAQGGVLCPNCGPLFPGAVPVAMPELKVMRHCQRSSFQEAARLPLTPALNRQVEALMQHYLTYLLEQKLNTPPFLQRARNAYQAPLSEK